MVHAVKGGAAVRYLRPKLCSIFFVTSTTVFFVCALSCILVIYFDSHWLSAVFLIGCILHLLGVVTSRDHAGVSLLFSFFTLFFIGLPAYVQIDGQSFPWRNVPYDDYDISRAYLILSLSMITYVAVDFFVRFRSVFQLENNDDYNKDENLYIIRWLMLIMFFCYLLIPIIGLDNLLSDRSYLSNLADAGGLQLQLMYIGRSVSLLMLVYYLHIVKSGSDIAGLSWHLLAVSAVFFIYNYPGALPRFQLLGSLLAVVSIFVSFFNPYLKAIFTFFSALFLFYIFPAIKVVGYGGGVAEMIYKFSEFNVLEYLCRVDFDAFKQIVDTVIYIENGAYRYGMNFIGAVLFFVPRAIWNSKPIDSGEIVSSDLGYFYNNVANPLHSEAYISFGYVGVVLVFTVLSYIVTKIEVLVRRGVVGVRYLVLYSLLIGYIVIVMRGALNGVAPQFASGFMVYIFLVYLVRIRIF